MTDTTDAAQPGIGLLRGTTTGAQPLRTSWSLGLDAGIMRVAHGKDKWVRFLCDSCLYGEERWC